MQIEFPREIESSLLVRAAAAGFATVEEYLLSLVERDTLEEPRDLHDLPPEDWNREFRGFLRTLPSRNPHFDDSRESIYPVR